MKACQFHLLNDYLAVLSCLPILHYDAALFRSVNNRILIEMLATLRDHFHPFEQRVYL